MFTSVGQSKSTRGGERDDSTAWITTGFSFASAPLVVSPPSLFLPSMEWRGRWQGENGSQVHLLLALACTLWPFHGRYSTPTLVSSRRKWLKVQASRNSISLEILAAGAFYLAVGISCTASTLLAWGWTPELEIVSHEWQLRYIKLIFGHVHDYPVLD